MPRRESTASTSLQDADVALLSQLLREELPSRRGQISPARLRSASQQRRTALQGFKLRNWVDRALMLSERALLLAALLAFLYWLGNGYGRDLLHYSQIWLQAQQLAQAAEIVPLENTDNRAELAASQAPQLAQDNASTAPALAPTSPQPTTAAPAAASLPFTRPDAATTERAPQDAFMVPQVAHTQVDQSDPRPRRLLMPSIAAEMSVYEIYVVNGEWEVAEYAAGFHNGTTLPGNVGNSVISGHAGLRGAVFRDLYRLQPGDEIIVETGNWRYVYRMRSVNSVWPYQVEVMDSTPTPVLTLITCTNWDTQRLIVVADLVDARPLS